MIQTNLRVVEVRPSSLFDNRTAMDALAKMADRNADLQVAFAQGHWHGKNDGWREGFWAGAMLVVFTGSVLLMLAYALEIVRVG